MSKPKQEEPANSPEPTTEAESTSPLQTFHFPEADVSVEATTLEEATKKLKALKKEDK